MRQEELKPTIPDNKRPQIYRKATGIGHYYIIVIISEYNINSFVFMNKLPHTACPTRMKIVLHIILKLPTYLPIHLPTYPPTYPPTYLPTYLDD
jgi:hypothetical protein